MKADFRKLLLLCWSDSTRDGIPLPFADGEFIYATDGRIIVRTPLAGMGSVPVDYGAGRLPDAQSLATIFRSRGGAQLSPLCALYFPDREFMPEGIVAVTPCKIGNALIHPRYINLFRAEFPGVRIEINSPGGSRDVTWKLPDEGMEGILSGMVIKGAPCWVWDMLSGEYLLLEAADNTEAGWKIKRSTTP